MRLAHLLLICALCLTGCGEPAASVVDDVTPAAFNPGGAPTVVVAAGNMHCEGCAEGVAMLLEEQPGVVDVRVDLEGLAATIAYDESLFDAAAAQRSLVEAGYAAGETADEVAAGAPAETL